MTADRRPTEALEAALRHACEKLNTTTPGTFIVIFHRDGIYKMTRGRFQGHMKPGDASPFIAKADTFGETLGDVRDISERWFSKSWRDKLVLLDEHASGKNRRVVVLDLGTLEPRVIAGRIVAREYSTAPPKDAAEAA